MRPLASAVLFIIFSICSAVEEDAVNPEFPIIEPFWVEDFGYEMAEDSHLPETSVLLRWSRIRDYGLFLSHRIPMERLGLSGDLTMSREDDFIPTQTQVAVFRLAIPVAGFWTAGEMDYGLIRQEGDFTGERSSISSSLSFGTAHADWNCRASVCGGSTDIDRAASTCQMISADLSRKLPRGLLRAQMEWRRETALGIDVTVSSADFSCMGHLGEKVVVGGGVYCGGSENLQVYPRVRLIAQPISSFLFRTDFSPEIRIVGSHAYFETQFSSAGRPSIELHSPRLCVELVWFLDGVNTTRSKLIVEKIADAVLWEWNFEQNRFIPKVGQSYERRALESEIRGGARDLLTWSISTSVNQFVDPQDRQIPNNPVLQAAAEVELSPRPFFLSTKTRYCGTRFATRGETNALQGYYVLSLSVGLKWERLAFLVTAENLTDEKYQVLPLVSHKGREYSLALNFTSPR